MERTGTFRNVPVEYEENKSSILPVEAIFKIVYNQFALLNRQARVNVNATHASPCQKNQFSKTLIVLGYMYQGTKFSRSY